jgi:hypothetical protein
MGLAHSPRIVTNGLVFAYDMANTHKSWKGAPTTNLQLPNIIDWSNSAIVALMPSVTSPTGSPVYSVTDNTTSYPASTRNITVPNDSSTYTLSIHIAKTFGGTSATLGFNSGFSGGTTLVQLNQRFNSDTGVGTGSTEDLGDWWRWKFQLTNNSSGNTTLYCSFYPATGFHNSGDNATATGTAIVSAIQIEQQPYATPFVVGTRSNTQAIVDLTGNNTVTATSLTYASDGTFSFNGSSNSITFPENSALNTQTPTVEVWVKTNATTQNGFWFEKGTVNSQYSFFQEGSSIQWRTHNGSTIVTQSLSSSNISTSNYSHCVATIEGGQKKIYVNGVLKASVAWSSTIPTNANGCSIGAYGGYSGGRGYYYNGNIALVKIYNRALTASEVQQNFNALRGRYGL